MINSCVVLFMSAIMTGIIFKRSKIFTAYIYIVMVILAAYRTASADFSNYVFEYNNINVGLKGGRYIGFSSIEYLFSKILKLPFEKYLILFYIITFGILIISIRVITKNVNIVLALYLIFSFGIDAVQMKSLLADSLSLLSISLLWMYLYSKQRKNVLYIIASFFIILVAALIHFSVVYYIISSILILINYNKENISRKMFWGFIICLILIYNGFLAFIISFANKIGMLNDVQYLNSWISKNTSLGWLVYALAILSVIIVAFFLNKIDIKGKFIKIYIMTSIFLIPLIILNGAYFRLMRIYYILIYAFVAEYKFKRRICLKELIGYVILALSIMLAYKIEIYPVYENTLGALFMNNSLFK